MILQHKIFLYIYVLTTSFVRTAFEQNISTNFWFDVVRSAFVPMSTNVNNTIIIPFQITD